METTKMFACDRKTLVCITFISNVLFFEHCRGEGLIMNRKFVVRRDLSDYCKRGVITSVFLGTHVVEANSQILQFSKREADYSCRFCVRTEYGNNIVMVIRNKNDEDLSKVCKKGSKQVVVYNMGETFGGYWASMPDYMRKTKKYPTGVYTIGTTNPTVTTVASDEDNEESENEPDKKDQEKTPYDDKDYISIEIPIVNISRKLRPGEKPDGNLLDILLNVDEEEPYLKGEYFTKVIPLLNFSVGHASDEKKLISAIKPSTQKRYQKHRKSYDIDWNRLLTFKKSQTEPDYEDEDEDYESTTTKSDAHRLVDLLHAHDDHDHFGDHKSHKSSHIRVDKDFEEPKSASKFSRTTLTIKNPYMNFDKTRTTELHTKESHLSRATTKAETTKTTKTTEQTIIETTEVTPEPVIERTTETENNETKNKIDKKSQKIAYFNKVAHPVEVITNATINKNETNATINKNETNATSNETTSPSRRQETGNTSSTLNPSVSMVDHESWENVVIGAPKMMENLNKTTISTTKTNKMTYGNESSKMFKINVENSTSSLTLHKTENEGLRINTDKNTNNSINVTKPKTENKKVKRHDKEGAADKVVADLKEISEFAKDYDREYIKTDLSDEYFLAEDLEYMSPGLEYTVPAADAIRSARQKRLVQPISIRNVFPRAYNDDHIMVNHTPVVYEESNIQKIEQHVELQNDKVNSRISIRYETLFLGEELFNLCDGTVLKSKHVFLFNTSRIMIQIENFVMDMVTIVLTEGRTVAGTNCEEDYLECQLAGNRVCIDAMNACDGVPNCGADDIYDEDRLKCGYLLGIQHDVYLAAVTFLVLILTLLYVVHYWLKRCVPKVSSAFFVYTEGAEIKLNLGTLMKSPIEESDEEDKIPSSHHVMDYDQVFRHLSEDLPSCWERFKMFCCFQFRRRNKFDMMYYEEKYKAKQSFSFPEIEISKLTRKDHVGVQTSFEMGPLNLRSLQTDLSEYSSEEFCELKELNVMNFCRDSVCKECDIGINTDMPMSLLKQQPRFQARLRSQQLDDLSTDLSLSESNSLSQRGLPGSIELAKRERARTTIESVDVHTETMPRSWDKRLRFDEIAVTIDNKGAEEWARKSKSVYGTKKLGQADLNAIEEAPEYKPAAELRKFLMGKNKKGKKKTLPHTR